MALDDIVSVTITTDSVRVSRASYGTPMVAAYHTHWADRVRSYSSSTALSALVGEGFATDSPAYMNVRAILSQNPRVRTVKVGRRDNTWTQITRLTPASPSAGDIYAVDINGTTLTVTADGTPTVAEIVTALTTAINGSAIAGDVTATDATTHVTVTADAADTLFSLEYVANYDQNYTILDQTADSSPDDDLDAIYAADPAWYGLVLDSPGSIDIATTAAWAEAHKVLYHFNSADSDIITSSTTDLFSDLQDLSYARSIGLFHPDQTSCAGAAWMGKMLPSDPGTASWKFKTLAGVSVTTLDTTEEGHVSDKSGNTYLQVAGQNITSEGVAFDGSFADDTQSVDWIGSTIQENVFALVVSRPKLPYTDRSVDLIRAEILGVLQTGVDRGMLRATDDDGNPPSCTAPAVADVDSVDRANRLLPDVVFSAVLAGAIHNIEIQGNLSI